METELKMNTVFSCSEKNYINKIVRLVMVKMFFFDLKPIINRKRGVYDKRDKYSNKLMNTEIMIL